jgi:hypothetical protein
VKAEGILAYSLMEHLPLGEQIGAIDRAIRAAAAMGKPHYNDAIVELLKLLEKAYRSKLIAGEPTESAGPNESPDPFLRHLIRLYWVLPDCNYEPTLSGSDRHPYQKRVPTMLGSKAYIIATAAAKWTAERTKESIAAFRFLVDAYDGRQPGAPQDERRYVSPEEHRCIDVEAIRTTAEWFTADALSAWLEQEQNCLPRDIGDTLAKARARKGGFALALRDIRYARFLAPLELEKRSPSALALTEGVLEQIERLDKQREYLADALEKSRDVKLSATSGTWVAGVIEVSISPLPRTINVLTATVHLSPAVPGEVGRIFFEIARAVVAKECRCTTVLPLTVHLRVDGTADENFELACTDAATA